jgi:hypothetical protein
MLPRSSIHNSSSSLMSPPSPDRFGYTAGGDPTLVHRRMIDIGATACVHEVRDNPLDKPKQRAKLIRVDVRPQNREG